MYIQIIDGVANLTINKKDFRLCKREGIIIPVQKKNPFTAKEQFKMISTIIKRLNLCFKQLLEKKYQKIIEPAN